MNRLDPCLNCGGLAGRHRIGCLASIARAALISAAREWHQRAHAGDYQTCSAPECYACHPDVLPGAPTGEAR